jgi:hypothetical protein
METLRCLNRECGVDVSASDWARLTRLRSDRCTTDVAELFYPGIQSEGNDRTVGLAQLRVKDFFSTQDDDGYHRVYAAVLRCPEMRFPDIHAVLKTTKLEGKVMNTVLVHVVQWLNRYPTQVGDRDSNKPLLRYDLLPPLQALYGDKAEPKSLELERKVLAYVRDHTNDFINPSLEHYLQAYPDGHCDDYIERFKHESWRTVLTIVYDITGPHFQHEALIHFNTNNPSYLDSKPVSAIAQVLCHSLSRIPEVLRNPALQGKKAAEALCHEIHPLVMAWAAKQCEDALTDRGSEWPPATIQLVQAEQVKYQALAPARPAGGPEVMPRSVRDVGIQTTVQGEFERPWTQENHHPMSLAGDMNMNRENASTGRHSKDLDPNLTRRAPIPPPPWRPRQPSQAPILAIGGSERQNNRHTGSSAGWVHLARASHSAPSRSQVPPNKTKPAGGRSWRKRPAVISGKLTS